MTIEAFGSIGDVENSALRAITQVPKLAPSGVHEGEKEERGGRPDLVGELLLVG